MSLHAAKLDRALRRHDAWRRPPLAAPSEQGSYKEWFHFCVRLPGEPAGHLLVNFNVTERTLESGAVRVARVITLAHSGDWSGHVESIPDAAVRGTAGEVDLRFGTSSLRLDQGVFELRVRSGDIEAHLRLQPEVLPTGTSSVSFGNGYAMNWVAVPRLLAAGNVRLGNRRFRLDHAPAYHDHNWGHFRWGADLAWDWGFVHPVDTRCPWNVIFVRVSDGLRHRTLTQGAIAWNADRYLQAFHNEELSIIAEGAHVGPRPLTIPGVVGLLVPGAASGVPARMTVRATGVGDSLVVDYQTRSKARVAVPSDAHPLRTVLLNESEGAAHVHGRIGGERLDFEGTAIVEFVRG